MFETWLPVPGYEGFYEASDYGEVRSLDRTVVQWRNGKMFTKYIKGRTLKQSWADTGINRDGEYWIVSLSKYGERETLPVHKVIALTHVPGYEPGLVVRHRDGNSLHNHASNLQWGTASDNWHDAVRHGTLDLDNMPGSKITPQDVRRIRWDREKGNATAAELAHQFKISVSNVYQIVNRRTWRHVE